MDKIKIKLIHGGKIERATRYDSGGDLFCMGYRNVLVDDTLSEEIWFDEKPYYKNRVGIAPNETIMLLTGVQIKLPEPEELDNGFKVLEAQIRGRSGLSLKKNTNVKLGTVDNEYIGMIGIIFKNESEKTLVIDKNDKIAQIVFNEVYIPKESGIEYVTEFEDTRRGENGFGSTNK